MEYYTISQADMGQRSITAFGRKWIISDFFGKLFEFDLGRRVFRAGERIRFENARERDLRLAKIKQINGKAAKKLNSL